MAQTDKKDSPVFLILDSFALIHRAYHAYPPSLTTKDGQQVNAVYGFAKLCIEVFNKFKPDYVVAAYDSPGGSFRDNLFTQYKANRSSPEIELSSQFGLVQNFLQALNIPVMMKEGFEADDIIGTLVKQFSSKDYRVIIVTGDKDMFQLVEDDVFVYMAGSAFSESKLYDAEMVKEKMGVPPSLIIDLKAIQGDPSDNIPGVAGLGPKSAVDLLTQYSSLQSIYKDIDNVSSKYQAKLLKNKESAFLSQELATIHKEVPIQIDLQMCEYPSFKQQDVNEYLKSMQFSSLIGKLLSKPENNQAALVAAKIELQEVTISTLLKQNKPAIAVITYSGENKFEYNFESIRLLSGNQFATATQSQLLDLIKQQSIYVFDSKKFWHSAINNAWDINPINVQDLYFAGTLKLGKQIKPDLKVFASALGLDTTDSDEQILLASLELAKLDSDQLNKVFELENRLALTVANTERVGVNLDESVLKGFAAKIEQQLAELSKNIFDQVGYEFNIGSPKQVGEALYVKLGVQSRKKTKGGAMSTDERTLLDLAPSNPVIYDLLKFRELSKLLNTYVLPLPEYVLAKTGKIHTTYNQLGAITGRFSSTEPNLQNLPINNEDSGMDIRKAFYASKDHVYVSFDYSQQELRILASFSEDEKMLAAFTSGYDIHTATASTLMHLKMEDVTKDQRRIAKMVNFGIVYGMSAFGLADRLKIDQKAAAEFITAYFNAYKGVKTYFENLISKAKETGYVTTILGRHKDVKDLNSTNYQIRQATEREIVNFPLQGSAADIVKLAMLACEPIAKKYSAKMCLQIHDELVFEYPNSDELTKDKTFLEFISEISQTMAKVVELNCELSVGASVGLNLADGEKII